MRGDPPQWNLVIKNCVFIFTCLNFSHLQSTLHLSQYTNGDCLSTSQNSFWTHHFCCLLVLLPFFYFNSSYPQNVSLWVHKVARGGIRWIGRVGLGGHAVFGKKLLNTECGVGRRDHKSPIMKWTDMWKASSLPFFLPLPSPPHPTRPGQIYSWFSYTLPGYRLTHLMSLLALFVSEIISFKKIS